MEDVHHDAAEIGYDPLAERESIDAERLGIVFLFEPVVDFAGDGFELRLGLAGADDKKVGESG